MSSGGAVSIRIETLKRPFSHVGPDESTPLIRKAAVDTSASPTENSELQTEMRTKANIYTFNNFYSFFMQLVASLHNVSSVF